MTKRSALDEAKQRIKDKLQDIKDQEKSLVSIINETSQEANACAQKLLGEKKKSNFFKEYSNVNQKVENALKKLLLIKDAIYSLDDDDECESDSSESNESDADDKSECSVATTATERTDATYESSSTLKIPDDEEEEAVSQPEYSKQLTVQKTEAQKVEAQKAEAQKAEAQKAEAQKAEAQKVETQKAEAQKVEAQKAEAQKVEAQKAEARLLEIQRVERQKPEPQEDEVQKLMKNTENYASNKSSPTLLRSESRSKMSPSARVSPLMRKAKLSSTSSSIITVASRTLSGDVKVPKPIFKLDIAKTLIVTEVQSPWSFYIQVVNPAYDDFMEQMCLHFSREASQGYKGGISNIPSVGMYCCAKSPIDSTWYRAQTKRIIAVEETDISVGQAESTVCSTSDDPLLSNIHVEVFLVDEGSTVEVPVRHLRPLEQKFSYLPAQAIHCMLAGVAPIDYHVNMNIGDVTWSQQCSEWFDITIKSEDTFTGYIHATGADKWPNPVDLYANGETGIRDSFDQLPCIESNIGYLMLLASMAQLMPTWNSHLLKHAADINELRSDDMTPLATNDGSMAICDEKMAAEEQSLTSETDKKTPETQATSNREIQGDAETTTEEAKARKRGNICASQGMKAETESNEEVKNASVESREAQLPQSPLYTAPLPEDQLGKAVLPQDSKNFHATFENRYKTKELEVGPEGFAQVVISTIQDPSLFFVHLITPDVVLFDSMLQDLNDFYCENDLPPPDHLDVGNAVVAKFSEDANWYRGLVKNYREDINDKTKSSCRIYEVFHVDFGSTEWLPATNVRPVAERFFQLPVGTLACCLADVQPMESSRDVDSVSSTSSCEGAQRKPISFKVKPSTRKQIPHVRKGVFDDVIAIPAGDEEVFDDISGPLRSTEKVGGTWSTRAVKLFKELTLDGKPRVVSIKDGTKHSRLPDEPWQVYLYNTNGDSEIFINNVLVDESLAVSSVYTKATERAVQGAVDGSTAFISSENLTDRPEPPTSPTTTAMDKWRPMDEEYLSRRNAYTINTDDPAVATMNISEPKRNICSYFLSRHGCFKGSACNREHSRPGDMSKVKLETFCIKDQRPVEPVQVGSFMVIQVTHLISPVQFYVRFPFGVRPLEEMLGKGKFVSKFDDTDELYELQQSMDERYSRMPFKNYDLNPFAVGELIAAKFSEDGHWYRCQVNRDLDGKYEVFFVDYGNVDIVDEKDTRKLLPEFLFLEIQAVEASLSNLEIKPTISCQENLIRHAMQCFANHLGENQIAIARIMSRAINGTLYLELYDKQTNININNILLKTMYFQEIKRTLIKPWDMSKSIAVNTSVIHMIPG
eukprot:gene6037-6738_t